MTRTFYQVRKVVTTDSFPMSTLETRIVLKSEDLPDLLMKLTTLLDGSKEWREGIHADLCADMRDSVGVRPMAKHTDVSASQNGGDFMMACSSSSIKPKR